MSSLHFLVAVFCDQDILLLAEVEVDSIEQRPGLTMPEISFT